MGKCNFPMILFIGFIVFILASCNNNYEKNKSQTAVSILRNAPDYEENVINLDKPWEKGFSFPCICKNTDTNMYYMYYSAWTDNSDNPFVNCVAFSSDGLSWNKPNLTIQKWEGKETNIISSEYENMTVSYYDGIFYLVGYKREGRKETVIMISKDGINFEEKVNTINYVCDSSNELLKRDNKFFLYMRSWYEPKNENIEYHHSYNGFKVYRSVSLIKLDSINQEIYNQKNELLIWGDSLWSALTDEFYPIVMKNISNEDYDIYNPCIHIYNDGSIIAYPILYYHTDSENGNDGYSKIGYYTSKDLEKFEQVDNKYIESKYWLEFAQGHYEDENKYIHYYVKTNQTHGSSEIGETELCARIHYK